MTTSDTDLMNDLAAHGVAHGMTLEDSRACLAWANEMFQVGRLTADSRKQAQATLTRLMGEEFKRRFVSPA